MQQNVEYFIENDLISLEQSHVITLDIYKSFDWDYDTKGVFLDILREFDKVWHKGRKQTSYINKIQTCFKWTILFISRN